ncbi:receptor for activated protein kinase C, putative [Entamoeba invadens IP1]|uniref:Receptor for activated protein kinase C, putative n=2 Tax=Entamoeba invadens TaxID=33085 RepID=A0A0A1U2B0_ENTIV|nr:receptor for activated protein kinase C, putative [Entamoeba invadens IP1]ELP85653.1 receptor for activated protein kinase C, putative [Entamoeba invadens IP1]BAN41312.1 receptor for activated protein kinase C, putative [Entamoeba invadens]BAN41636.1 receptor for activated protein kinase C, putative [Entamoeba invadens]|eukprot:XP_004184999.1 receptor for activated protein kinase C, putative [Entamoeba invadens IP1]
MSGVTISLKSTLNGHKGAVTTLATSTARPDLLVSGSRDKTLLVWNVDTTSEAQPESITPQRSLHGHSHFISDLVLSSDGKFAITSSWDQSLRLWDLEKFESTKRFVGHEGDVLSVAFSQDNTKIISGSRDKTIRLWNTLGKCIATVKNDSHTEWVSCVRFVPNSKGNKIVSGGWDKLVKTWTLDQTCKLESTITHHNGFINTIAFSPDGSIMATAGKDGVIAMWSLNNGTGLYEFLYDIQVGCIIYQLVFAENPEHYTLIAATEQGVAVVKDKDIISFQKTSIAYSVTLSATRDTFFTGHADNSIKMWKITTKAN